MTWGALAFGESGYGFLPADEASNDEIITVITKGAIKKPKYINNRDDIERIVAAEVERVLNPVIEQAKPIEKPVIQQKVEQALTVNPQLKKSLELAIVEANKQINEYMEELDDEEAIFYLFG